MCISKNAKFSFTSFLHKVCIHIFTELIIQVLHPKLVLCFIFIDKNIFFFFFFLMFLIFKHPKSQLSNIHEIRLDLVIYILFYSNQLFHATVHTDQILLNSNTFIDFVNIRKLEVIFFLKTLNTIFTSFDIFTLTKRE